MVVYSSRIQRPLHGTAPRSVLFQRGVDVASVTARVAEVSSRSVPVRVDSVSNRSRCVGCVPVSRFVASEFSAVASASGPAMSGPQIMLKGLIHTFKRAAAEASFQRIRQRLAHLGSSSPVRSVGSSRVHSVGAFGLTSPDLRGVMSQSRSSLRQSPVVPRPVAYPLREASTISSECAWHPLRDVLGSVVNRVALQVAAPVPRSGEDNKRTAH